MEGSIFRRIATRDERMFVDRLLVTAFPDNERPQPRVLWQRDDERFSVDLIVKDSVAVGFISQWRFDEFVFVEHLAVEASMRNGGIGTRVIRELARSAGRPVVLEAELPMDDLSARRIGFYERNGFVISSRPYFQPSYGDASPSQKMRLMIYGNMSEEELSKAVETILTRVYNVPKDSVDGNVSDRIGM